MTEIKSTLSFLTVSICILLNGCFSIPCSTHYIKKACSPDQRTLAACYYMNCGATTGGPFSVGLIENCTTVSDTTTPYYLFTHGNPVSFIWHTNDSLEIIYYCQPLSNDFEKSVNWGSLNKTIYLLYSRSD